MVKGRQGAEEAGEELKRNVNLILLQKRWEGRQRGNKGRIEEEQEEQRRQVERQREEEAVEERLEDEEERENRAEGLPRLPPSSSFTFSPETIGPGPQWYPTVLRVAALNSAQTGNMGGINAANYACYREAMRAGLRGSFRAFLSSGERSLESVVRYRDRELPVVNTVGEVLSPAWKDLFHSSRQPLFGGLPIYSFSGKDVLNSTIWPVKSVWHGLGQAWGGGGEGGGIESSPPGTCGGWRSASPLAVGLAGALGSQGGGGSLLAPQRVHCNKELVALCIEATSPSNTFDRRRRSVGAYGGEESSKEEMLEFSEHVKWLGEMDSIDIERQGAGKVEAKERPSMQSRGERQMKSRTNERQADSREAGGAKTYY